MFKFHLSFALALIASCTSCEVTQEPTNPENAQGISAVWIGALSERDNNGNFNFTYRSFVIYDGGEMRETMPLGGLLNFDAQSDINRNPGQWRQFTNVSGNNYNVTKPGSTIVEKAELKNNGSLLNYNGSTYKRVNETENHKGFSGTYTTVADGVDIPTTNGRRPVIRFEVNGNFTDEGIMDIIDNNYSGITQPPGQGTYRLQDYSIVFTYEDGRTKQLSFVKFDADVIRMQNSTVFRR
jgi:hypothetical protein